VDREQQEKEEAGVSGEDKFKHHDYLQRVADGDVRFILEKDRSYGASWKASGGRSAWFMLVRKIDRLRELMKKPADPPGFNLQNVDDTIEAIESGYQEDGTLSARAPGTIPATVSMFKHLRDCYTAENIFAMIRKAPDGADGTVLAEVRDLRRYLLLVEAEMMARGVVAPPAKDWAEVVKMEPAKVAIPIMPSAVVGSEPIEGCAEWPEDFRYREVTPTGRLVPRSAPAAAERPDADGTQHASMAPWAVNMRWRYKHDMQPGGRREAEFDRWWRKVADGVWVLEPAVEANSVVCPHEIVPLYFVTTNTPNSHYVIDIGKIPADARGWFPVLPVWRTLKELEGTPLWARSFYRLERAKNEYLLLEGHRAWSVGAEDAE
jgi:hypothetical protein